MKIIPILFISTIISLSSCQEGRTFLENFLQPFRVARRLFTDYLHISKNANKSHIRNKLQKRISESLPFPCNTTNGRSLNKPTSAHRVRPGDIDVVAALGDSLTAGLGITAIEVIEIFIEERGKVFSIGGDGTWKRYMTLPNILKVFNPNLVGYSEGDSLSIERGSHLNVAESMAISADMPYMGSVLINRIKEDPRIKIQEDWKMITIFLGANDFCTHICYRNDPFSSVQKHRSDLIQVLRLFRDHLPRTIVNVISAPHMRILLGLKFSNPDCELTGRAICSCFIGSRFASKTNLLHEVMTQWQRVDMEVCDMSEFDKDDFTVVFQPFTLNYTIPSMGGFTDESYFGPDCFHFSQKMHARIANDLWNNIMEPVSQKSLDGNDLLVKFLCPSEDKPYIFTKRNS